ncbi:hypothetical protein J6A31_05750 [bacterium]|nr:hypothetical protein [bacterium]
MAQKLVLEMSIYTDGDWSYQKDIIRNYTSKYFDNYLYEYTEFIFDYESRFRRVFDFNGDFKPVENLIRQICDSIKGRDTEYIKEFFDRVIEVLPQTTIDRPLIDEMDSNTEINIIVKIIETDAKEIDRIIYKN